MINNKLTNDQGEIVVMDYHFDYVDEDFLRVFKVDLAAGRDFLPEDKNVVLINETMAKKVGWSDPLSREIPTIRELFRIVGVISLVKDVFEKNTKSQPWEFSFYDDDFNALYRKEQRTSEVFGAFTGLAVFIAGLGLRELAAFAVERRTKRTRALSIGGSQRMTSL